jgi:NAD-dependent DNA ligase
MLLLQQQKKTMTKYEELKRIATEIRHHDRLYYVQSQPVIGDDEYDALVRNEATICTEYPTLLKQYEIESGLGSDATRYGGRIGPILDDNQQHTTQVVAAAETTTTKKKKSKKKTAAKRKTTNDENADESGDVPTIITRKQKHLEPMLSLDKAINVMVGTNIQEINYNNNCFYYSY